MKYFYDAGGRADVGIDNPAALDIATIVLKARARHSVFWKAFLSIEKPIGQNP